jgi:hypothetical protein
MTHHHDFYDFKKTVLRTFESLDNATLPSLSDNFSINPVIEANDKNDREKNNGQNAVLKSTKFVKYTLSNIRLKNVQNLS